jgi:hypothetical protein
METFDFVSDVGASDVIPEVVEGKLRPANESDQGGKS